MTNAGRGAHSGKRESRKETRTEVGLLQIGGSKTKREEPRRTRESIRRAKRGRKERVKDGESLILIIPRSSL